MPDIHLHQEDLKASLPAFLTALAYGAALYGMDSFLGVTGRELKVLLQVEFLVIHSFPFLCVFAWMGGEGARTPRMGAKAGNPKHWKAAFWGMLALYLLVALSMGWMGPIYFLVATATTYPLFLGLGRTTPGTMEVPGTTPTVRPPLFRLSPKDQEDWWRLGSNWVTCFILYIVLISFFDLSNNVDHWRAEPRTYWAGLGYFVALGILELWGFHDRMVRILKRLQAMTQPPSIQP